MNTGLKLPGTRERLIAAMREALSTRGFHGVGLNELLSVAGAPKGVLYHHFPGGKTELAIAAIVAVVEQLGNGLDLVIARSGGDVAAAFSAWMAGAQKLLESSGFERGCPLATVALESTPDDLALRAALSLAFVSLRQRLRQVLEAAGVEATAANNIAALMVSAYEGSLIQARVAGSVAPMREASAALLELIRLSLPRANPS
jgi:TetR/AcrR family transcriptional regulator, lmrAB and yxaGH operons repressor